MNNTLTIAVGTFAILDNPEETSALIVLADDAYSTDSMTFDDVDHLLACYPTQDELIKGVLGLPAFAGAAEFDADGSYTLDPTVSEIVVKGYPQ